MFPTLSTVIFVLQEHRKYRLNDYLYPPAIRVGGSSAYNDVPTPCLTTCPLLSVKLLGCFRLRCIDLQGHTCLHDSDHPS